MILRFLNQLAADLITYISVSDDCMPFTPIIRQSDACTSIIRQFHEFFNLIFGKFWVIWNHCEAGQPKGPGIHSSDDALSHEGAINKRREKFSPLLSRRRKVTPTTRPATHILGSSFISVSAKAEEAKPCSLETFSPCHL